MKYITRLFIIVMPILLLVPAESTGSCRKHSFRIAIDIGHSKNIPGAISARGKEEFYFNQDFSVLLLDELKSNGFSEAFVINKDGTDIPLTERADAANKKNADLFISIHHDSVQPRYLSEWEYGGRSNQYSDLFSGYSLFYSGKNTNAEESLLFARLLGSALRSNFFAPTLHHAEKIRGENRELVDKEKGIYRFDDLVVLKNAGMPAILLECGIIVNRSEETLLSNPAYRKMLAMSIRQAIEKFCEASQNGSSSRGIMQTGPCPFPCANPQASCLTCDVLTEGQKNILSLVKALDI